MQEAIDEFLEYTSSFFTLLGFEFGKKLSEKIGRYSFLLGGVILLFYSVCPCRSFSP